MQRVVERDDFLETESGQRAELDGAGRLRIVDRMKDMINISGFKVWPAEVEHYLYRMPGVQEVAVYGIPAAQHGEAVAVALVPRAGAIVGADDVIAYCRENMAAYKVPAKVDILTELPKSPSGKLLKRILRERHAAQAGR